MTVYSPAAVYALAREAGLTPARAVIATAIAGAESGWDSEAVGDESLVDGTWGPSIGLWQVRSQHVAASTGGDRDATALPDPRFNAQAMASISKNGTDWSPWSTYKNGAYRRFLGRENDTTGGAGTDAIPEEVDVVGEAVDALNPFAGWQDNALRIAIVVAGVGTALALVVVGLRRTVSS